MSPGRLLAWRKYLVLGPVRLYQLTLSPLLGGACRFEPTCSRYMVAAVEKHGLVRGAARGLWRLCRCHPWGGSGYDPVD